MREASLLKKQSFPTDVEELLGFVENLPTKQKAQLIERLVGRNSGLSVVFDNNQLLDSMLTQIDRMTVEQLSEILQAIAQRLRN